MNKSPTSLQLQVYYDVQQLGIRNFRYKKQLEVWLEWHQDTVYEQMPKLNNDILSTKRSIVDLLSQAPVVSCYLRTYNDDVKDIEIKATER